MAAHISFKRSKPVVLILAAILTSTAANAIAMEQAFLVKTGLTAETAKDAASVKDTKAPTGKSQSQSARSGLQIRCWNYGKLVYEAPVGSFVAVSAAGNVVTVPGTQQKQILDMRSGLCVIE